MPFDINQFRTHLSAHGGVSRTDKFDAHINIPQEVSDGSGYGVRELALQCEVSELPGRDINMIEFRHYGFTKRIPHMNQYNQITLTFYCAGDLIEKKLFDRWIDLMIPVDTGLVNYPLNDDNSSRYEADIQINQYGTTGDLVYTVNLVQAVPVSVASMPLDWNNDQVHRLTVTFAYLKWTSDQTTYGADQTNTDSDTVSNFTNDDTSTDQRINDVQPPTIAPPQLDLGPLPTI
jgi:hypothetical protein